MKGGEALLERVSGKFMESDQFERAGSSSEATWSKLSGKMFFDAFQPYVLRYPDHDRSRLEAEPQSFLNVCLRTLIFVALP